MAAQLAEMMPRVVRETPEEISHAARCDPFGRSLGGRLDIERPRIARLPESARLAR